MYIILKKSLKLIVLADVFKKTNCTPLLSRTTTIKGKDKKRHGERMAEPGVFCV